MTWSENGSKTQNVLLTVAAYGAMMRDSLACVKVSDLKNFFHTQLFISPRLNCKLISILPPANTTIILFLGNGKFLNGWRGKCFLEKRPKKILESRFHTIYALHISSTLRAQKLLFQSCWIICNWNYASPLYKFFLNKSFFSWLYKFLPLWNGVSEIRNVHCVVKGEEIIMTMKSAERRAKATTSIASEEATNCKRDEM